MEESYTDLSIKTNVHLFGPQPPLLSEILVSTRPSSGLRITPRTYISIAALKLNLAKEMPSAELKDLLLVFAISAAFAVVCLAVYAFNQFKRIISLPTPPEQM